jgi:hypothetical protein
MLVGLDPGPGSQGRLASYTWDGTGADGPWPAGPPAGACTRAASLAVELAGNEPTRWQARWAPIRDGTIGESADAGSGTTATIVVRAPAVGGAWSLVVTAWFGAGRNATWTWRVQVAT